MRKSQKIITTVLWSFLVLTMVAVVGRGMWANSDDDRAATGIRLGSDAPIEQGLPILYDAPRFALTDQDGKPFDSEQLNGQVWVAAFIFTNCPQACPMMTQKMAALQQAVPSKNVKLVSFSVDPERDTPAVLKQYAQRFEADESRWHFLTGKKEDLFATAAGMKLSASPAEGERPIQHAEHFLLVDTKGRVRGEAYHSNQEEELKQLAVDAAKLAGVMTQLDYQPVEVPFLRSASTARALSFILIISGSVVAFLFWLIYFKPAQGYSSRMIAALPAVNASLNGVSSVLLVSGYRAIRRRNVATHLRLMLAALVSSALFFISYVVYHNFHGDTKFTGVGMIRPAYFFILISHIALSVVAVPLILTSFYLALAGRLAVHKKVARVTFPIWLYVSVTGVLIFVMLKLFS